MSDTSIDRRLLLQAAAGAVLASQGTAEAQISKSDRAKLQKAVEAGHDDTVKRLQQWIANPSIAAENRNTQGGAEYMKKLALDAGFQQAEVIATDGVPGVFATLDVGAKRWMGIYFMYDVKQFDPAEWSSPPLEAAIVERPGLGKVMIGRGAVNEKGPQSAFLAALDAFRTAVNWAVDHAWFGPQPEAVARTDRLQAFFERAGMETYPNQYRIDGTPLSADRSAGLIASNGAASLAASHPRRLAHVAALWALEPPSGRGRYYNGLLQFMAMLHASGNFRIY